MMQLRCPRGCGLALVVLTAVLALAGSVAPVRAQGLQAAWMLPAVRLQVAEELLAGTSPLTCDPRALWQDHFDYVSCVARETLAQVAAGSLTITEGQALLRRAVSNRTDPHGLALVTRRRP